MKYLHYRILPLLLAASLQVMPLLRSLAPAPGLAPSAWSIILKIGMGATALLGSYDAVSGASVTILPPVNGGYAFTLTNGVFYRLKLAESPYAAGSWTPTSTANTTTPVFTLFDNFNLTNATGYLGGTPVITTRQTNIFTIWVLGAGSEASHSVSALFTNYALPAIPGSITVTAGPPALVTQAKNVTWSLDGVWQTNATTNIFVMPGSHTINFTNIVGWVAPTNQVINVTSGVQTVISVVYTQVFGGLQVNIQPLGPPAASGTCTIDGGPAYPSGIVTNVAASSTHTVAFTSVSGYGTPGTQTVSVTNGFTNVITGVYVSSSQGTVFVNITPPGAVSAGAMWQLDNGPWLPSGSATNGSFGSHTVNFESIPGWTAPPSTGVTMALAKTTNIAAAYVLNTTGAAQVTLAPPAVVNAGARWQMDGGALETSGLVLAGLTPGSHTLSYSSVAGWLAPGSQNISITSGLTNSVTATYAQITAPVIAEVHLIGSTLKITGTGTPGAGYSVLSTNSPVWPVGSWPVIGSGTININGTFEYDGLFNSGAPATFYRVRSP